MSVNRSWKNVKNGDVLQAPYGVLRIARQVSYCQEKNRTYVHFTIKHCSWTHRCYTVYTVRELISLGYTHTGVNIPLKSAVDREIDREITQSCKATVVFHCCDVIGLP